MRRLLKEFPHFYRQNLERIKTILEEESREIFPEDMDERIEVRKSFNSYPLLCGTRSKPRIIVADGSPAIDVTSAHYPSGFYLSKFSPRNQISGWFFDNYEKENPIAEIKYNVQMPHDFFENEENNFFQKYIEASKKAPLLLSAQDPELQERLRTRLEDIFGNVEIEKGSVTHHQDNSGIYAWACAGLIIAGLVSCLSFPFIYYLVNK